MALIGRAHGFDIPSVLFYTRKWGPSPRTVLSIMYALRHRGITEKENVEHTLERDAEMAAERIHSTDFSAFRLFNLGFLSAEDRDSQDLKVHFTLFFVRPPHISQDREFHLVPPLHAPDIPTRYLRDIFDAVRERMRVRARGDFNSEESFRRREKKLDCALRSGKQRKRRRLWL
ncbi:unnamed protein product [Peniophora sp. CBMAI 1063]|nr:unnamed protein product [Peniophora sp. CBMAI 1063]